MRCGWCETHNQGSESCVNCGGPLAHPGTLGPPPPPVPRTLPARFGARVLRPATFDLAFLGIGVGGASLFLVGAPWFPPFLLGPVLCAPFAVFGVWMVRSRRRHALGRIATLQSGAATLGTVRSVRNEGPSRWRLTYAWEADGAPHTGEITSEDAEITRFTVGDPVHIVVREGAHSDLWPPMP